MKTRSQPTPLPLLVFLGVLLGGCTAPDISRPATAAREAVTSSATAQAAPMAALPDAPTANVSSESAAPVASPSPMPQPQMTPEVAALVVHLTETEQSDTLAHDLVDTTGFPEAIASLAPGATAPKVEKIDYRSQPPPHGLTAEGDSVALIDRDWTGLVLVPINKSLSKAYTSAVKLLKVEAHPLQDGRVRVWIRMQNIGSRELPSEIACAFSMRSDNRPVSPNFYELQVPSREFRDVFFVSPAGDLLTYTVLIRSNRVNYRVSQR